MANLGFLGLLLHKLFLLLSLVGFGDDVTSIPLERRTLAIFLRAEFGFLGVAVLTAVQTPLFCGEDRSLDFFLKELKLFCRAGAVDFLTEV